jgi:hypothetical protein
MAEKMSKKNNLNQYNQMEGLRVLPFFLLTDDEKLLYLLLYFECRVSAQSCCYWQQHVDYKMDVTMDVKTTNTRATEIYTNNS